MAFKSQPTVTRPANVTAYDIGDVVGGAFEFPGIGPFGGDIMITSAALRINSATKPAGMTSIRYYLYDVTPPSAIADNAAWDLPAGDRASFLGYIDVGSPADLGSTAYVQVDQVNKQIRLRGSASVFAYMVTASAYTPAANSEVYVPELNAVALPN